MGVQSTLEKEATAEEPARAAQSERIEQLFREHNDALARFLLARLRSRRAALAFRELQELWGKFAAVPAQPPGTPGELSADDHDGSVSVSSRRRRKKPNFGELTSVGEQMPISLCGH